MDKGWVEGAVIALWVVVAVQFVIILFLAKLVAQFLNRFRTNGNKVEYQSLVVGEKAPHFREVDQKGRSVRLADPEGRSTLLLFTMENCDTCRELLVNIAGLTNQYRQVRMIIISNGKGGLQKLQGADISYVDSPDLMSAYFVEKVPAAVMIDRDGYVAFSGSVTTPKQVEMLLEQHLQKAS